MSDLRNIRVVAAIIEIDSEVLLVRQQGPTDSQPTWALPGGRVEPGESLIGALAREVFEETGLILDEFSPDLRYVCEVYDPEDVSHFVVFVFRARLQVGRTPINDPDGHILEARFIARDDAIALLETVPYPPMSEPSVMFLRGNIVTFWYYRISALGLVERVLPVQL